MLIRHRGEVEFDFRTVLHSRLLTVAKRDPDEMWRSLRILLRRPDTEVFAAVAGWERPLTFEAFMLGSLYTAWVGKRHPFLPDLETRSLTDVETRLADMALESMNRR